MSDKISTDTPRRSKVLIVDDMPVNRTILSSMLATKGIESDLASGGAECIELCRKNTYDLILLDHRMPDLDGVDTLTRLKEDFRKSGTDIPIICHTTEEGRKNINLYKAAGFADVLIKPVDPEQLSSILMTYLPEGESLKQEDKEEEKYIEDELSVLPGWLKTVPKLDLMLGLKSCETAEDYVDALNVFYSSIKTKSEELEKFAAEENWPMVTLRVHSLKSIARLVGAVYLADHAADLEYAGKNDNIKKLKSGIESLVSEYRAFIPGLSPLNEVELNIGKKQDSDDLPQADRHTLLFIGGEGGIVSKGITKHLEEAGFRIISVSDKPVDILSHRLEAGLMLYYPCGDKERIRQTSAQLSELACDEHKILCLTGDPLDIEEAMLACNKNYINAVYPRPVDMDRVVKEMVGFSNMQKEFYRTKTILIIDDDLDFLTIMGKWLKEQYKVDCAQSGQDALVYLNKTLPDLILLDYEMPDLNGFQVMQEIRHNPQTYKIPIIFLTGKNERENVLKILERKPDGYLLKSMSKEALLDSLNRFFAGNILHKNDKN